MVFKLKSSKNQLVYFESFPIENAGYQYRAQIWLDYFALEGITGKVLTIVKDRKKYDALIKQPHRYIIRSMWVRYFQIIKYANAEVIIVRRELLRFNDYGNLFFEKFLLKLNPNVILDFDDDIAAAKKHPKHITSLVGKILLENGNKFNETLKLYPKFIVASNYLKELVLKINPQVAKAEILVIPTCVNYDQYPQKVYDIGKNEIIIGWIGASSNQTYLIPLIPVLKSLKAEGISFKILIISNKVEEYLNEIKGIIQFEKWSLSSEIESLLKIDIGIMPLDNTFIEKGKGGFKLIQYMGLGIVSIASPITINQEIVTNNHNGFLADTPKEWEERLKYIISNQSEFTRIGDNARKTINENYSFSAHVENYMNFVQNR